MKVSCNQTEYAESAERQENMDLFCDHTDAVCKVCGDKGIAYAVQKCIAFVNRVMKHRCGTTVFSLHAHSGVPRNFVWGRGGSTKSVEDRENGDLVAVAP